VHSDGDPLRVKKKDLSQKAKPGEAMNPVNDARPANVPGDSQFIGGQKKSLAVR
jgi:hypothetical protein